MARTRRCWYCSRRDAALTDEHVLSEDNFGGRLVSPRAVCDPCNRAVGKLERHMARRDAYVAEYVGRDRLLYSHALPQPEIAGVTEDRATVRVHYTPDGVTVAARPPRRMGVEQEGTEVWEVAAGAEAEFRRRRQTRDPNSKLRVVGLAPTDASGLTTRFGIGLSNIDAWPRLGAKVALSLASLVFDDAWLDSREAAALQAVLARRPYPRDVFPSGLDFGPVELDPNHEPGHLLRRGEHVLGLDPDDGGWMVMILFGALHYQVPLLRAPISAQACMWHLKPDVAPHGPMPERELVDELRARLNTMRVPCRGR